MQLEWPVSPQVFGLVGLLLCFYVSLWALVSIAKKRADLADIAWGPGFILVAWTASFLNGMTLYGLLVNTLVTLWGVRLSLHIYLRNRNRKEDFRYETLKRRWGTWLNLHIFTKVFLLQGCILYIVALPILWIHTYQEPPSFELLSMALFLWLVGFVVEAVGDYQLACFQKNPLNRGKLLTGGLWQYVRHPNYLGELMQWWGIWLLAAPLPFGYFLIISPLLLTFLIVKVSGVAPLEKRMEKHPEFHAYKKSTPCLFPSRLINIAIYWTAWFAILFFADRGSVLLSLGFAISCYIGQVWLFMKSDQKSLLICIPLSIYALVLGMIQELCFMHLGVLAYPKNTLFPPLWLLALYPLFGLTFNSSLSFLNRYLPISFVIGGLGALFSYLGGEELGKVHLFIPLAYLTIVLSWGSLLTLLILLNRRLITLREYYTDPQELAKPLTVFFDQGCPICSREMKALKARKQTGVVHFACLTSPQHLQQITDGFSYEQAMRKLHAIDVDGNILTGTLALSHLYARTNHPGLAILLQAPGFRQLFQLGYAIWARFRRGLRFGLRRGGKV